MYNYLNKLMTFIIIINFIICGNLIAQTAPQLNTPTDGATGVYLNQVFTWSDVQGAVYKIQISTSPTFGWNQIDVQNISGTSYQASGLYQYTPYYWRVGANTGAGYVYSSSRSFTTGSTTGGGSSGPVLLSPTNGAVNVPINNTFSWNVFSGATSYRIQISTSSTFGTIHADQTVSTNSYTTSNMYLQTQYYWRVLANTSQGATDWSTVWSFTTASGSTPGIPVLSSPVHGTWDYPVNGSLTWLSVQGATSYRIQVSTSIIFDNNQADQTTTATSYTLNNVSGNSLYYWRVKAISSGGESDWAMPWAFFTASGPSLPAVPILSLPVSGASGIDIAPTLFWNVSTGASTYGVQVSTSSNFSTTVVDQSNLTSTSLNISGLSNNTQYYWRVNATNSEGTSEWSTTSNFTTLSNIPDAPQLATPANGSVKLNTSLVLNWNSVTGAESYGLQVSTDSNFTTTVVTKTDLTGTTDSVTNLNKGTTYFWRVNASNGSGTSEWSDVWNFTTDFLPLITLTSPADSLLTNNSVSNFIGSVNDAVISLKLNGTNVTIAQDNSFNTSASLDEGINTFTLVAKNSVGDSTVIVRTVFRDSAQPVLSVIIPSDSLLTNQISVTISGIVTDANLDVVTVNGDTVTVEQNGSFSKSLSLSEGENTITIIVNDNAGNSVTQIRKVFKDTSVPVLSVTSPQDSLLTDSQIINVTGLVHDNSNLILTIYHAESGQSADTVIVQQDSTFSKQVNLVSGYNNIIVTATDAAGNTSEEVRLLYYGSITIQLLSPEPNWVTNADTVQAAGHVSDTVNVTAKINNVNVPLNETGNFSQTVLLSEGKNDIIFKVGYVFGNNYVDTITVFKDSTPPALTVAEPVDSLITNQSSLSISGTASDDYPFVVTVNDDTVSVNLDSTFNKNVNLIEGVNTFIIMAEDSLNNISQNVRTVIKDSLPPIITIVNPQDGFNTEDSIITITGNLTDSTEISLFINGSSAVINHGGLFSYSASLIEGNNIITFSAEDQAGNISTDTLHVTKIIVVIPPPPVAPPVDSTVVTTIADATEFLYKGEDAVQKDIDTTKMEKRRIAVLKGKVLKNDGSPLGGTKITVLDHPEFGYTTSRADGLFDIVVNGGGFITLDYNRFGYLPVQRQIKTPWQDFENIEDVIMLGLDPAVTKVNFTQDIEIARGSIVSDSSGERQATLMFKQGTVATMTLPDGSTQVLDSINVRATEYTVGDNGPKSMPAALPLTSAYTYCVELSVDEALTVNAKKVEFNNPLPFYIDNFLEFPVGIDVPLGYYDRDRGQWLPEKNGRIIKIVNISNGIADVDINGDDTAEDSLALADTLGITQSEREKLASLYSIGKSLWRVEIPHFSAWDANWGFGPPADAVAPGQSSPFNSKNNMNPCNLPGSIIGVQDQTLSEFAIINGTPFSLFYNSKRLPGYKYNRNLIIPLSIGNVPASLKEIELEVSIAGKTVKKSFPPNAGLSTEYLWDGKNAYNKNANGSQQASVRVGYKYNGVYERIPLFGYNGKGTPITGSKRAVEVTFNQTSQGTLSAWNPLVSGLGGWSLNIHHSYDPEARIIYKGDGTQKFSDDFITVISTIAGTGTAGRGGYNIPASDSKLNSPSDVEVDAEGNLYISDKANSRILKVNNDGIVSLFAGNFHGGFNGDNIPATSANFGSVYGIAFGPDGSLYIADEEHLRIKKIDQSGLISTVAGTGVLGYTGDGGPAVNARIAYVEELAVGQDGSLYFYDYWYRKIRKVDPNGIISTFAGTGASSGFAQDGTSAISAPLPLIGDMAVGPDGSLYYTDVLNSRVRKITTNGIILTIAGNGIVGNSGDGDSAIQGQIIAPSGIYIDNKGIVYFCEGRSGVNSNIVRRVTPDGIMTTIAGKYSPVGAYKGDGDAAVNARFKNPRGIAVAPNGTIYISDYGNHAVRKLSPPLPSFNDNGYNIVSDEGDKIYIFDKNGKHIETVDALTGNKVYRFNYNTAGVLISVTDINGLSTTIERNIEGKPAAVISPFGERTEIEINNAGYIESINNAADESTIFEYDSLGLMTKMTDPKGNNYLFTYDSLGLLIKDQNPAGGFTELSRTNYSNGHEVTATTAEGRIKKYKTARLSAGGIRYTNIDEGGLETVSITTPDGKTVQSYPDGSTKTVELKPSPRFGLEAPLVKNLIYETPLGSHAISSQSETITQMTGNKVTGLVDTFFVNNKYFLLEYNDNTKAFAFTTPEGRQAYFYTDTLNQPVKDSIPGIEPVTFKYNLQGFVSETEQGFRKTLFAYDTLGRLAAVTDPLNRTESYEYDAAGRITKQTLQNNKLILYSYDANGNLASITPPGKPSHNFIYNNVDLTESYTPPFLPDTTNISYVYNLDKQLTHIIRPDNQQVIIEYDTSGCGCSGVGKPKSVLFDRGTLNYEYSPLSGYLSSVVTPENDTLLYTYDGSLPLSSEWQGSVNGKVSVGYNNDFQVVSQTINSTNTINYNYDDDGLLISAGDVSLNYNTQNGLLTGTTIGSITDTFSYNNFGEISNYSAKFGTTDLFNTIYAYDSLGRITNIIETVEGNTDTTEYTYNSIGYLIEVKKNGTITSQYEYDDNGNRVLFTDISDTLAGSYDEQDRMLSYGNTNYIYTKNGDLSYKITGIDTTKYTYDNFGNLTNVTLPNGTIIDYVIDGQNRRVAKKVNGSVIKKWLYEDQLNPVAELNASDSVIARFIYGSTVNVPDYIVKNNSTYKIVTDHLGSVRLVVNTANGEIAQRINYDEFGNVLFDSNPGYQPFYFAGGFYELSTGLTRFGARDYDGFSGRWTNKDPILFEGGLSNIYEYVANDPINYVDIDGTQILIGPIPNLFGSRGITIAGFTALGALLGAIGGGGLGLGAGPGAVALSPALSVEGAGLGAIAGASAGTFFADFMGSKGSSSCGDQPASEGTAKDMAKQIERDLGKNARREFHDAKWGNDRTLQQLRKDALELYTRYGKTPPKWLRPR